MGKKRINIYVKPGVEEFDAVYIDGRKHRDAVVTKSTLKDNVGVRNLEGQGILSIEEKQGRYEISVEQGELSIDMGYDDKKAPLDIGRLFKVRKRRLELGV